MPDTLRRYCAIRNALTQAYPVQPQGPLARHLHTLAALLSGMVDSTRTQRPNIAANVPKGTKPESRVKPCARWFDHPLIVEEVSCLPYADVLLRHGALQTLGLVLDGRGGTALMIPVVSKGRALPLAGRVRHAPQGHCPDDLHLAVVELVRELIPAGAQVVLLGEGEGDGTGLQHTLQQAQWAAVCRTGNHLKASWDGETFRLDTWGACRKPGTLIALSEGLFSQEDYGPMMRICGWAKGWKEPRSLVSHRASAAEAGRLYSQRFRIETFCSAPKSRGFPIHKSPISDPQRHFHIPQAGRSLMRPRCHGDLGAISGDHSTVFLRLYSFYE